MGASRQWRRWEAGRFARGRGTVRFGPLWGGAGAPGGPGRAPQSNHQGRYALFTKVHFQRSEEVCTIPPSRTIGGCIPGECLLLIGVAISGATRAAEIPRCTTRRVGLTATRAHWRPRARYRATRRAALSNGTARGARNWAGGGAVDSARRRRGGRSPQSLPPPVDHVCNPPPHRPVGGRCRRGPHRLSPRRRHPFPASLAGAQQAPSGSTAPPV